MHTDAPLSSGENTLTISDLSSPGLHCGSVVGIRRLASQSSSRRADLEHLLQLFPARNCRNGTGRCSCRSRSSHRFSAASHKLGLLRRHSGHCLRCSSQAALAERCSSSKRSRSRMYSESMSRHARSCASLCFSAATIADTYLLWSSRPTRHLITTLRRIGAYKSHYRRGFQAGAPPAPLTDPNALEWPNHNLRGVVAQ